jgi:large subunit ribosomal protein L25
MQAVELKAELREGRGKELARRLRSSGKIPAVFYGPKRTVAAIEIDAKEFQLKVASLEGSHLIRLQSSAADLQDKMALVKDTQHHPVSGDVLHTDLYEVDMTARLTVPVPLHFVGKAEGVVLGGILQPVRREIEVECFPTDIPEYIEIDVTALNIHDAVHVTAISLPAGVTAVYETDFAVVTVLPPTIEAAPAAAEAEVAAEPGAGEEQKTEGEKPEES